MSKTPMETMIDWLRHVRDEQPGMINSLINDAEELLPVESRLIAENKLMKDCLIGIASGHDDSPIESATITLKQLEDGK